MIPVPAKLIVREAVRQGTEVITRTGNLVLNMRFRRCFVLATDFPAGSTALVPSFSWFLVAQRFSAAIAGFVLNVGFSP